MSSNFYVPTTAAFGIWNVLRLKLDQKTTKYWPSPSPQVDCGAVRGQDVSAELEGMEQCAGMDADRAAVLGSRLGDWLAEHGLARATVHPTHGEICTPLNRIHFVSLILLSVSKSSQNAKSGRVYAESAEPRWGRKRKEGATGGGGGFVSNDPSAPRSSFHCGGLQKLTIYQEDRRIHMFEPVVLPRSGGPSLSPPDLLCPHRTLGPPTANACSLQFERRGGRCRAGRDGAGGSREPDARPGDGHGQSPDILVRAPFLPTECGPTSHRRSKFLFSN